MNRTALLLALTLLTLTISCGLARAQDARAKVQKWMDEKGAWVSTMQRLRTNGQVSAQSHKLTIDVNFGYVQDALKNACAAGYGEVFCEVFHGSALEKILTANGKDTSQIKVAAKESEVEAKLAAIRVKFEAGADKFDERRMTEFTFRRTVLTPCLQDTHDAWLELRQIGKGETFAKRFEQTLLKENLEYYGADTKNLFKTDEDVINEYLAKEQKPLERSLKYHLTGQDGDKNHFPGYCVPATAQRVKNRFRKEQKKGRAEVFVKCFDASRLKPLLEKYGANTEAIAILEKDPAVEEKIAAVNAGVNQAEKSLREGMDEGTVVRRYIQPAAKAACRHMAELQAQGKGTLFRLRLDEEELLDYFDYFDIEIETMLAAAAEKTSNEAGFDDLSVQ